MAFEYGTQKLNIRNPFRFEGLVRSIRGLIVLGIGIYLLLQLQTLINTDKTSAWMSLALGGLFCAGGLKALGGGLFQMMRFFVGRVAPASLARNNAREAVNEKEPGLYDSQTLHGMMMNKSNPTFVEPTTWFGRAVHSIFPNLIVTPWPIRNMAQELTMKLTKSLIAVFAYLVASLVLLVAFAGNQGGEIGQTVITLALQGLLFIYLVAIWVRLDNPLSRNNMRQAKSFTSGGLTLLVIAAIALPILVANGWTSVWADLPARSQQQLAGMLPRIEAIFSTGLLLMLVSGGAILTAVIGAVLIRARTGLVPIQTTSSEMNNSWRYDLHPRQIFTTLRDFVLMQKRQLELPNRVYLDQNDTGEANRENEQFNGDLLVEIQPTVAEPDEPASLRWTRIAGTVVAQLLLLAGALVLWSAAENSLAHIGAFEGLRATGSSATMGQAFDQLLIPMGSTITLALTGLLLLGFGRSMSRIVHLFWSEIFFQSNLFDLHCEGTVMRATHYRGADRHSASSEQDVFSFDSTYFALATQATSSTFAVSGQQNLEQPRYLLSLANCDGFMNSVISDLQHQFERRDDEIKAQKREDREERLDYIREEQAARRTGDLSAQGLVSDEAREELAHQPEDPLDPPREREQIAR